MRYDFDIVILGGGAAGLFAASVASSLGAKACIVERKRLGGDCTWSGCIPSKALLKSGQVFHLLKRSAEFGLGLAQGAVADTSGVMAHVRKIVGEVSGHHPAELFEKRGVRVIFGQPQFIDRQTIEVNGRNIASRKFLICTGSRPLIPAIEGLAGIDYLTNENVFDLNSVPESLIVLGGGPIGVELAQAFSRLGAEVTIVEMAERIMLREDREIAGFLERKLESEGVRLLVQRKAVRLEKRDGLVCVTLEEKGSLQQLSGRMVLIAAGRQANVDGLFLERAGVRYDKSGVKVNQYLQTSCQNIFACGDVTGPFMFSHMAAYQAQVCVRNALFKRIAWQRVNYENVAWSTFTDPEISHLGLTEEEAAKEPAGIKVYKTAYGLSDRAVTDLEKDGLIKVITDRKGRILGAHIAGANSSEVIHSLAVAKSARLSLGRLSWPIFIYPTLSELIKKTAAQTLTERLDNPAVRFFIRALKNV